MFKSHRFIYFAVENERMINKKTDKKMDSSTEERIKQAAKEVFQKKGFAAARTRDIAETADINLALVNYYFRSKEKLFDIVMAEALVDFIGAVAKVVNNEQTTLEVKVKLLAKGYTEILLDNADLPFFIMSEIRRSPQKFISKSKMNQSLMNSTFNQQLKERTGEKGDSFQLFISLIGMIVFPFISAPLFKQIGGISDSDYKKIMRQRIELIPGWFIDMIKK